MLYENCFPATGRLAAYANIKGDATYPDIHGQVRFYEGFHGTIIQADIRNLPRYQPAQGGKQPIGPFGFHIHIHPDCMPVDAGESFSQAGGHYNPTGQHHGHHAGDLPVLMPSRSGIAQMTVYIDAFLPQDIFGKSVMVHENPDDYRTDPAGNAGRRIACGPIIPV